MQDSDAGHLTQNVLLSIVTKMGNDLKLKARAKTRSDKVCLSLWRKTYMAALVVKHSLITVEGESFKDPLSLWLDCVAFSGYLCKSVFEVIP